MGFAAADVRVRVVLAVALVLVAGVLVLDASGSAPRSAGSDHVGTPAFSTSVSGGHAICQPVAALPADAATVQLLIGTNGHPVPDLLIRFIDPSGRPEAVGHLAPGAREGLVTIPLRHVRGAPPATSVCLHVGGSATVLLGGEAAVAGPGSAAVEGKPQAGRIGLSYLRGNAQSWWQLLPELTSRFGLGKASFFGDWTLPVMALLLLGVWVGAVRLLAREMR